MGAADAGQVAGRGCAIPVLAGSRAARKRERARVRRRSEADASRLCGRQLCRTYVRASHGSPLQSCGADQGECVAVAQVGGRHRDRPRGGEVPQLGQRSPRCARSGLRRVASPAPRCIIPRPYFPMPSISVVRFICSSEPGCSRLPSKSARAKRVQVRRGTDQRPRRPGEAGVLQRQRVHRPAPARA